MYTHAGNIDMYLHVPTRMEEMSSLDEFMYAHIYIDVVFPFASAFGFAFASS